MTMMAYLTINRASLLLSDALFIVKTIQPIEHAYLNVTSPVEPSNEPISRNSDPSSATWKMP